ncbi:Signal recognition particle receptor beta subunit [Cryptosporidium parvum]|uniref:Signal recognition particle receptor subunit beta n=1 Tax=Cryptosporidium parvum TaxID=5807 RepID=A0A7S7LF97_CRYPV|nr:Signal recognition particle receptor beta subunit [Cryptosporidium parvum]WRK32764.1 Signal recognition particle receptor beta subunit [Cryptosporidium parvum]|eukprot:QOY41045.1 hypothetical protein CPATCC_002687 [Cryptosporidium parvum]
MFWELLFYTIAIVIGVSLLHSLKFIDIGIYLANYIISIILFSIQGTKSQNIYSLIIGPSGSGKTTLFYKVKKNKTTRTTTSIVPGVTRIKDNRYLVDIPGNRRIINDFILKYLNNSVSIIFVIDSNDKSSFKDAAEILFSIIREIHNIKIYSNNDSETKKQIYRVLILFNKSDLITSRSISYIKDELERSIERLFNVRYCNSDHDLSDLIDNDMPFSFENLHNINFQFMKLSIKYSYDEFKSKIDSFLQ